LCVHVHSVSWDDDDFLTSFMLDVSAKVYGCLIVSV
jgi:hypothetical protein